MYRTDIALLTFWGLVGHNSSRMCLLLLCFTAIATEINLNIVLLGRLGYPKLFRLDVVSISL